MCIRDRMNIDKGLTLESFKKQRKNIHNSFETTHTCKDGSPVSYTHLRAHETVLDLVCRLLLEKKKNIIT